MADVFISYARSERADAERLARRIEGLGLSVFLDVDGLDGGDVFSEKLDREVKTAGCVLGLWSPASLSRPWVQIECDIGKRRGVLVPVAIHPFRDMDVPAPFWNVQFVDLTEVTDSPDDPAWLKLRRSLARTLNRQDLAPPRPQQEAPATAVMPTRQEDARPAMVSPRPDALPKGDAAIFYLLVNAAMHKDTITLPRLVSEARRLTGGRVKIDQAALGPAFNRILRVMLSVQQETGQRIPPIATLAIDPSTHLPPSSIDAAARAFIMDAYEGDDASGRIAELTSDRVRAIARLQTAVFAFNNWVGLLPYVGLSAANPEAYLRGDAGPPAKAKASAANTGDRKTGVWIGAAIALAVLAAGAVALFVLDPLKWRAPKQEANAAAPPMPGATTEVAAIATPSPDPAPSTASPVPAAQNASPATATPTPLASAKPGPAPAKPTAPPAALPTPAAARALNAVSNRTPVVRINLPQPTDYIAISPDLRYAAIPDSPRYYIGLKDPAPPQLIHIHDLQTQRELRAFQPGGPVYDIAYTPDGSKLVVASDDAAYIQDAASGAIIRTLRTTVSGKPADFTAIAISRDGTTLYLGARTNYGGTPCEVTKWRVADGQMLAHWVAHDDCPTYGVTKLALSPDGRTLVSAGGMNDGTVKLWDAATGSPVRSFNLAASLGTSVFLVSDFAISNDGTRVAVAIGERRPMVWQMNGAGAAPRFDESSSRNHKIAWSPDGETLVTADQFNYLVFWDARTGKKTAELYVEGGLDALAYTPDGTRLMMLAGGYKSTQNNIPPAFLMFAVDRR